MTAYKPKASTKHPYAAIEHRVIDSAAFADLSFSSRSLLIMLTRQLTKDNNGHLQASFKYLQRFGFGSDRTVTAAVAELIAHGFIYRTRSGGYQQGVSLYAVTWLPIKNRTDIFLDGFKPFAWREWCGNMKKTGEQNLRSITRKKCGLATDSTAKNACDRGAKNADYELMPCIHSEPPPPSPKKYRAKKRPEQMAGSTETQLSLIL